MSLITITNWKKLENIYYHLKPIQLAWAEISSINLKQEWISTWMWKNYNDTCYFSQSIIEMDSIPFELNKRISCSSSRNCEKKIERRKEVEWSLYLIFFSLLFNMKKGSFNDKISRIKIKRLNIIEKISPILLDFFLIIGFPIIINSHQIRKQNSPSSLHQGFCIENDLLYSWALHKCCSSRCVDEFRSLNRLILIPESQDMSI